MLRMLSACTICMGMCGSGAVTGTRKITTEARLWMTLRVPIQARAELTGAGAGILWAGAVVQRAATGLNRLADAMTGAFVSPLILPASKEHRVAAAAPCSSTAQL